MKLECPNGHAAVVRHDPKSEGYLAMCDTCGWSAQKVVVREGGARFDEDQEMRERQLERAQNQEHGRRQLAGAQRRGDQ